MEIWLNILHGKYLRVWSYISMLKGAIKAINISIWRWRKPRGNEDARERDTTNLSAFPLTQVWEIKWEKEKRSNVLHVDNIQQFNSELKDVLSPMHVNQKCVFCILGQYSSEQYDAQIFGQRVLLILLVIELWVSWHIKKEKGLSSYWRALNVLCLSSLLKGETNAQCWAKIKKKENVRSAPCHNARMATIRKDVRDFASAVKQCWSRDIN